MSDFVSLSGNHAGTIWQILHNRGPLCESELLTLTYLTTPKLYTAVGWLARENKIRKENNIYLLGGTNLEPFIGKDAGKIWRALDIWGEVDVLSLSRLSRIVEQDVYRDWMACSGRKS